MRRSTKPLRAHSDNLISLWSKVILTETANEKKAINFVLDTIFRMRFPLAHSHERVSYVSVSAINTYLLRTYDRRPEYHNQRTPSERASETGIGKGCVCSEHLRRKCVFSVYAICDPVQMKWLRWEWEHGATVNITPPAEKEPEMMRRIQRGRGGGR